MNSRLSFLIALLAGLVLVGCDFGPPAQSASISAALAGADHKVLICHRREALGKGPLILSVDVAALKAHLRHGDTAVEGEICDGQDNDCDGVIDPEGVCDPGPCAGDACEPAPCADDSCEPDPCEDGGCEPPPCPYDSCEPPPLCGETGCIVAPMMSPLRKRNAH